MKKSAGSLKDDEPVYKYSDYYNVTELLYGEDEGRQYEYIDHPK